MGECVAVTTKLTDEANELLEFYLGYKRMTGERLDKEDAVAQFVVEGVRRHVPADTLALYEKNKRTSKAKSTANLPGAA